MVKKLLRYVNPFPYGRDGQTDGEIDRIAILVSHFSTEARYSYGNTELTRDKKRNTYDTAHLKLKMYD